MFNLFNVKSVKFPRGKQIPLKIMISRIRSTFWGNKTSLEDKTQSLPGSITESLVTAGVTFVSLTGPSHAIALSHWHVPS